ncbi:hypothetical protein D3C81_2044900 [compost metagenome]
MKVYSLWAVWVLPLTKPVASFNSNSNRSYRMNFRYALFVDIGIAGLAIHKLRRQLGDIHFTRSALHQQLAAVIEQKIVALWGSWTEVRFLDSRTSSLETVSRPIESE